MPARLRCRRPPRELSKMSRLQNVTQVPDTQALPSLLAAAVRDSDRRPSQPETVPFTKAELRRMILEIMG